MRSLLLVLVLLFSPVAFAHPSDFALRLCREQPQTYMCVKLRIPRSSGHQYREWHEMFRDSRLRQAVMKINRRNTLLWNGHTVAMPRSFDPDPLAYAPFPRNTNLPLGKYVLVSLKTLAWAAYEGGRLVRWGPANGGSKRCRETGRLECKTHPGAHAILKLHGPGKRSDLYPVDCTNKRACGHPMPYYMPFHRDGTGLHGDKWLVGRNASHGCVRMLTDDARWLNRRFAFVGMPVLVEDY